MRWWRRFRGGHWERWHIDLPYGALIWVPVDECHVLTGVRPPGAMGTPECEDYRSGGRVARLFRVGRLAPLRIDSAVHVDPAALEGVELPDESE